MFNDRELAIATDIINRGLQLGAQQLSSLMKETIEVQPVDLEAASTRHSLPDWMRPEDEPLILLQTDIVGEVGGICFLVFHHRDAQLLKQKTLPPKLQADPAMGEAILLETDNIVTAAVVTLFANVLQCKVHGGVPKLWTASLAQAEAQLAQAQSASAFVLDFKTHFVGKQFQFEPLFFWYLNAAFVERVQRYSQQQTH